LGLNNSTSQSTPQEISFFRGQKILGASSGANHNIMWTESGEVYVWGFNSSGQLGLGDTSNSIIPQKIDFFDKVPIRGAVCGNEHTSVWTFDNRIFVWGGNSHGQLGLGDIGQRIVPTELTSLKNEIVVSLISHPSMNSTIAFFKSTEALF